MMSLIENRAAVGPLHRHLSLRAEEKTVPAQAELPRDIDEFREALARRIEAFVAAHGHEEDEPPEESEDD